MDSDPNTNSKLGFGRARFRTAGREDQGEGVPGGARRRRRGRIRAAATASPSSCAHAGVVAEWGVMEEDPRPRGFLQR